MILSFFRYTCFIFLCAYSITSYASEETIDYLRDLHQTIQLKDSYTKEKKERIVDIKKMLETPNLTYRQVYDINLQLYDAYSTFISDSSLYYAKENLELALVHDDTISVYQSSLHLSSSYIIAGMYLDAFELMESIRIRNVPDWFIIDYYDTYKQLFKFYSINNFLVDKYIEQSSFYRDSLLMVLNSNSNHYKIVYSEQLIEEKRFDEAEDVLLGVYKKSIEDNHEKAILAYSLALVYKGKGAKEKQKYYLTQSASLDIKNSIKENAAMLALAKVLYEEGDVKNSYICVRSAMEDAMFSKARLRSYEVSEIFPIIDSSYKARLINQRNKLQYSLLGVSVLALFLILAVFYIYKQIKRVSTIKQTLHLTNNELNTLNAELKESMSKLNRLNVELKEANRVKETYIGHFLDLCSSYINKLEAYQVSLNKKAREKKMEELYAMLKSRKMIDDELEELIERFDNVFLQIYPHFVEDFNKLLVAEERIVLGPNELLNTELRIFALIRLGIKDSSRIASFLHYSPNTIYNYRTRMRNKSAVPRDEFEEKVMDIGVFSRK